MKKLIVLMLLSSVLLIGCDTDMVKIKYNGQTMEKMDIEEYKNMKFCRKFLTEFINAEQEGRLYLYQLPKKESGVKYYLLVWKMEKGAILHQVVLRIKDEGKTIDITY